MRPFVAGLIMAVFLLLGFGGYFINRYLVQPSSNLVSTIKTLAELEGSNSLSKDSVDSAPVSQKQLERWCNVVNAVTADSQFQAWKQRLEQITLAATTRTATTDVPTDGSTKTGFAGGYKRPTEGLNPSVRLDYRAMLDVFKASPQLVQHLKQVQLQAAKQAKFGINEYQKVKTAAYQSLGYSVPKVDLGQLVKQISTGDLQTKLEGMATKTQPSQGLGCAKALPAYYPLTWFGL